MFKQYLKRALTMRKCNFQRIKMNVYNPYTELFEIYPKFSFLNHFQTPRTENPKKIHPNFSKTSFPHRQSRTGVIIFPRVITTACYTCSSTPTKTPLSPTHLQNIFVVGTSVTPPFLQLLQYLNLPFSHTNISTSKKLNPSKKCVPDLRRSWTQPPKPSPYSLYLPSRERP